MEESVAAMENPDYAQASRYDITIAGKRFNITSRYGEGHIRKLERLVGDTIEEITARTPGQTLMNAYLLTALNLADQLLVAESTRSQDTQAQEARLERIVGRLRDALQTNGSAPGAEEA